MTKTDIQIAFCGSAGDGTIACGDIFKRAMARTGYKVIAFDIYPPEIRGFGKCIARVRVTSEQVYSLKQDSDALVSLNDAHAIPHVGEVRDYGAVIYDNLPIATVPEGAHIAGHVKPGQLPYSVAMREISDKKTSGAKSRNIVALGYVAGLFQMPPEPFRRIIADKFKTKAPIVTESNLTAFDAGYDAGVETFRLDFIELGDPKKTGGEAEVRMMTGNQATVRGCLDAGLDAFFGYPITPATSIMERLAIELPTRGGRMLQTEDEIAAISATIGAGYAGVRAATATSGPGLALMVEMLGLGVMAEVPCVIFCSQRGGPSTGMPTKTEQSDLHLAVYGGSGDAQRIVLAPTNVEGAWKCAGKAFEMAERYQTPVIVLLDLYLSNRYETVILPRQNPFDLDCVKQRDHRGQGEAYSRFAMTEDYVSPRAVPGGGDDAMHAITGLEHNEDGRPNDQPDMHSLMSEKRHAKLDAALDHPGITNFKRFGDTGAVEVGILGWGSTFGEILEAMLIARSEGIKVSAMKAVMLSPLPVKAIKAFFGDCYEVLIPELNFEGQFANLVAAHVPRQVTRLDQVPGVPMKVDDILAEIRRLADRARKQAAE